MSEDGMMPSERRSLRSVVRMREDLAKKDAKARSAKLMADVEEQLAKTYRADDGRWSGFVAEARRVVKEMDASLAEVCREQGIPEAFRPRIDAFWESRGENANKSRRKELHDMARARIDALEKEAIATIERRSVDIQTRLIAGGLDTASARAFLASLPTAEMLMPPLQMAELEAEVPLKLPRGSYYDD